jgi:replicative DNA helicase
MADVELVDYEAVVVAGLWAEPQTVLELPELKDEHLPSFPSFLTFLRDKVVKGEALSPLDYLPASPAQARLIKVLGEVPPPPKEKVITTARLLIEASRKRALESCLKQVIARLPNSSYDEARALLDLSLRQLDEGALSDILSYKDLANELFQAIESGGASDQVGTYSVPTLDGQCNNGLRRGHLVILSGDRGVGKTALALRMAIDTAKQGIPSLFFSLEMSPVQLGARLVAYLSGGSVEGLTARALYAGAGDLTLQSAKKFVAEADGIPLFFSFSGWELTSLISQALLAKARHGCATFFIDYLQKVKPEGEFESRQHEVAEVARQLKSFAVRHGCCVVALSQITEVGGEERTRESRVIEHEADVIIVLRPQARKRSEGKEQVIIRAVIAKNRMGPSGSFVDCEFDFDYGVVREITQKEAEAVLRVKERRRGRSRRSRDSIIEVDVESDVAGDTAPADFDTDIESDNLPF